MEQTPVAAFADLIDLAAGPVGGRTVAVSDEFFAPAENLLRPDRARFLPDEYTDRGKWMDGWESRRRRGPGHDWCIIRLGLPGVIRGVDVDTAHFLGNNPAFASLDACTWPDAATEPGPDAPWEEVLAPSPLGPGRRNLFAVSDGRRWTHVRLHIYPDGGVARLRVYGEVVPTQPAPGTLLDLACLAHGGRAVLCSDMFFSSMDNLLRPGPSTGMHDGWETRRRRGPGHDWVVIQLGHPGRVRRLVVETTHFMGNYPATCSVEGCRVPGAPPYRFWEPDVPWVPLLDRTPLTADARHEFDMDTATTTVCTHVRLNIYPDGGVARFRVMGTVEEHTA